MTSQFTCIILGKPSPNGRVGCVGAYVNECMRACVRACGCVCLHAHSNRYVCGCVRTRLSSVSACVQECARVCFRMQCIQRRVIRATHLQFPRHVHCVYTHVSLHTRRAKQKTNIGVRTRALRSLQRTYTPSLLTPSCDSRRAVISHDHTAETRSYLPPYRRVRHNRQIIDSAQPITRGGVDI